MSITYGLAAQKAVPVLKEKIMVCSGVNMNDIAEYFPYAESKVNYLTHCSKKYNYIYVETPKVACSTIKRVLQIIEDDAVRKTSAKKVHDRSVSPLCIPKDMGEDCGTLFGGDKYFRFAFVRNPFTRILSAYLDKLVENEWERNRRLPQLGLAKDTKITFIQFLEIVEGQDDLDRDIHWMSQSGILQTGRVEYNFIGRLEQFEQHFKAVINTISPGYVKELHVQRNDWHKTNASEKVNQYIGKKEKDLILKIYDNDFSSFCYSADSRFAHT